MTLRDQLTRRLRLPDVQTLCILCEQPAQGEVLFKLIYDDDDTVSWQALWVLTHCGPTVQQWLCGKQALLIDYACTCTHAGKRRLALALLHKQPMPLPLRTDFLNFCLDHMADPHELPAARSLCMKLAYQQCRHTPELLHELYTLLEFMEPDLLPYSLQAVRRQFLQKKRSKARRTKIPVER